ncbi:MAG: CBS domain-containing protein, partial [Haloplanus sp.]
MAANATVEDYMTRDVATVSPDDTVAEVSRRIIESDGHTGFPVTDGRHVEGFISARDMLAADGNAQVFTVM